MAVHLTLANPRGWEKMSSDIKVEDGKFMVKEYGGSGNTGDKCRRHQRPLQVTKVNEQQQGQC